MMTSPRGESMKNWESMEQLYKDQEVCVPGWSKLPINDYYNHFIKNHGKL